MCDDLLYAKLSGDATLTATVGSRIYPTEADEDASLPFLVYDSETADPQHHWGGPSYLDLLDAEVRAVATTRAQAKTLIDRVVEILDGFAGTAGGQTVQIIHFRSTNKITDRTPRGRAMPWYSLGATFDVWFERG